MNSRALSLREIYIMRIIQMLFISVIWLFSIWCLLGDSLVVFAQSTARFPVVGSDYNEVFKGFIEYRPEYKPHAVYSVSVESQVTKTRCDGTARITYNPDRQTCKGALGRVELFCSEGRVIHADLVCFECRRGVGLGYDQRGNRFAFAFGMNDFEAMSYIEKDLRSIYKPKETRQEKGFNTGTGFFVSTNGHLVTNYHVIEDSTEVIIVTFDKREHVAKVIKADPVNDVVLLKVETTTKPLSFSEQPNPSKGEEVFTLGYPLIMIQGQEQKATFGRINSLSGMSDDIRFMQIDAPVQHGNSGSPLMNMNGQVIGVITATLNQIEILKVSGSLPQNVNYALKFDYVIPLLRYGLSNMSAKPTAMKSQQKVTDLIKIVEPSVMMIIAK